VGVLSASSVDTDVAVDVCTHIIRCYSVAAQFQVLYTRVVNTFFLLLSASTVKVRASDPYSFDTDPDPGPAF
jgi:hypothetical protein